MTYDLNYCPECKEFKCKCPEVSESSLNDLLSDLLDIVEKSEFKNSETCKVTGLGVCRMKEKRESIVKEVRNYLGR